MFFFFLASYVGKGHDGLYKNPQQRKKEESERLRGERDQIKLIDLRLETWQFVGFKKAGRRQDAP